MNDSKIYKAINDVSKKVNALAFNLDRFLNKRADDNQILANEAQNATCELSEDIEERLSDIENALCELTEE